MIRSAWYKYENASALLESWLNTGSAAVTITIAKLKATRHKVNDSLRNCTINCLRVLPITLRMPISLARFTDRATVRFIKLMQAISKIKIAIAESMYEKVGLLL